MVIVLQRLQVKRQKKCNGHRHAIQISQRPQSGLKEKKDEEEEEIHVMNEKQEKKKKKDCLFFCLCL
jgi:hypothetical protein